MALNLKTGTLGSGLGLGLGNGHAYAAGATLLGSIGTVILVATGTILAVVGIKKLVKSKKETTPK